MSDKFKACFEQMGYAARNYVAEDCEMCPYQKEHCKSCETKRNNRASSRVYTAFVRNWTNDNAN